MSDTAPMRPATRRRIDELHTEIARLIEMEKRHYDRKHPGENKMWRHVAHCQIEMIAHSPKHRALMFEATAALTRATTS